MLAVIALLLLITLVAGRRSANLRTHRHLGPTDDNVHPYRSHAEASRRGRL
jgi:hypothetical protein